ncbi:MAG: glycogen/starch/alpha-glucan phosphorylase, partial [Proteobacteria bacterium]|nr:glycogen/starch/alpha-glucan phosphorylase [Pseudomonadota bacterium]
ARSVRDRMLDRWNRTQQGYYRPDVKRVYYLSLEFLIGRLLRNALLNLGMLEEARGALADFGIDIEDVFNEEWDAGLGNGGLGRLAACFLDSMATLGLPAMGYGIRYEYGIFRQHIVGGKQLEAPDNWLRYRSPWDIPRPDYLFPVRFNGRVVSRTDESGRTAFNWVDTSTVMAMAHDFLVPGYKNDVVNTLRLWSAKASREFDFANFNRGDYIQAVQDKNASENISRVLYPNDKVLQGRELRLKQEYFFVSATLQDAIRRHVKLHGTLSNFHEKAVFQLNDTHPALAVPELMRLLLDEHGFGWDEAWGIARRSFAYTNHTILPEALEQWPVGLLEYTLPRHMQIVYEINQRFLDEVRQRFPGDDARVQRMSLIGEGPERSVRMANVAIVGSFSVNGVSALHSDIVRDRLFRDFSEMFPERFNNKTNGVTPRRWIAACNPGMSALVTSRIGDGWVRELRQMEKLAPLAEDPGFREKWRAAKRANKERLAAHLERELGVSVSPDSLFDVQVKRIHEYKRQLLNILHALRLYLDFKQGRGLVRPPRTILIGGKAAPGYDMAKRIIHLANAAGNLINRDPDTSERLKLIFVPNYTVSLAELIIPAADLSEQISTAGTEASGTGNMKFAMNGALTIGTRDGANIEIGEAVGEDNIYFFGLSKPEVDTLWRSGYNPRAVVDAYPDVREVLDLLVTGEIARGEPNAFWPIVESLLDHGDPYLVLADFAAYRFCQARVDADFGRADKWTRMSILNSARTYRFSSDETIAAYAREIWKSKAP